MKKYKWICKICNTQFIEKEAHGCMNKVNDWKLIKGRKSNAKLLLETNELTKDIE